MKLTIHEEIPQKFKEWWRDDWAHAKEWRKEAKEDYDFVAGHQWTEDEKNTLQSQMRPVITFNRMGVTVDAVSGSEIGNRQEVRFIPREEGDAKPNELLTSAGQWFDDVSGAADEESEAFRDTLTGGMGWVETRLEFDDNPEGDPSTERMDPFEMVWDRGAKRKNLRDATRVWHVKKFPIDEAEEEFPDFERYELDAGWAGDEDDSSPHVTDGITQIGGGNMEGAEAKEVTIARVQWVEREVYWKVVNPLTGNLQELTNEQHQAAKKNGFQLNGNRFKRRVRKQAFLGNVVLAAGDVAAREHFNFKCITGKRDRNKSHWYGLVRSMKDPQRWHNKWLSQMLHIMNTNAKGGLLAEKDAFDDERQAEESWARQDRITWARSGSLSGPGSKVQPKPQTQFPVGFQYLTEFAASSIPDVSGVNVEMLGLREANQPGVLEYQRRQSGMTILQPLFDCLKAYRTDRGKLVLHYLQNDLSDGRLIRIVGNEQQQYVPLMKQADLEYDIIVDDSPTSPNQKEMIWSVIGPQFMKLPPQMMAIFVDSMPLPESKVQEVKKALQSMIQGQAQQSQQATQIAIAEKQAEIAKDHADAEAKKIDSKIKTIELAGADADRQLKFMEIQNKAAAEDKKIAAQTQAKQVEAAPFNAIVKKLEELQAATTATKHVVRDEDGLIERVETVN